MALIELQKLTREWVHQTESLSLESSYLICKKERWVHKKVYRLPRAKQDKSEEQRLIPRIDDSFDELRGSMALFKIDLRSDYHQIMVAK